MPSARKSWRSRRKGGAQFSDVQHLVAGKRGMAAMETGDTDGGIWSAGLVQGLIDDIPSVKDLIDRIMSGSRTDHPQAADGYAGLMVRDGTYTNGL